MRNFFFLLLFLFLCNCNDEKKDFLSLSSEKLTFAWYESAEEITVEADAVWTISSELPAWLKVNAMQGREGRMSVIIEVSENDTGKQRFFIVAFEISGEAKQLQIIQKAKEKLCFIGAKEIQVSSSEVKLSLEVEQNIGYELIILTESGDWIRQVDADGRDESLSSGPIVNQVINVDGIASIENSNTVDLEILENYTEKERRAKVGIYNDEYNLSDTIYITQEKGKGIYKYRDGEYKQFQQAKSGNGVNLIIMGDGFTQKDLEQGGRYETIMQQAADYFFSIEPYQSYRDYFNVYMVVAESPEEGVGTDNTFGMKIKNKFGTAFGSGTAITCDDELCFEYARKVEDLPKDKPLTIIIPLNSTKYAGTTYLYANGNSIALCPMSAEASPNDFEGLIHHEAGGHGFGFLCDEYVYYKTEMPESRKKDLREWQKLGFQCNLDFTNDLSAVLWKDFIGIDKYRQVGVYEGGYEYQYGVWRSEANSCMNDNIPYYNVQSRWSIVSRIMKLAGVDYTVHDFIEADHVTWEGSVTRSQVSAKKLPPLGAPKWIK